VYFSASTFWAPYSQKFSADYALFGAILDEFSEQQNIKKKYLEPLALF
jgi:hypothetical protein